MKANLPVFRFVVLLFFLIKSSSAFATRETDSLLGVLRQNPSDSQRVILLNKLSWQISYEKLDSGLYYGKQGLYYATRMDYRQMMARLNSTLGTIYTDLGQFSEAAQCYYNAIDIYKKENDESGLAFVYANMSNLENVRGNKNKMLYYLKEAMRIFQKNGNKRSVAGVCNNLASYYASTNNLDSAFYYINLSGKIIEEGNIREYYGNHMAMLGDLYSMKKDKAKAKECFDNAEKYFVELGNYYDLTHMIMMKANYAMDEKDWKGAIQSYNAAEESAKRIGMNEDLRNIYKKRSQCYEQLGDFANGLRDFQKYSQLNDSLNSVASTNKLNELNVKMETEKKTQELELVKKNSALQEIKNQQQEERIGQQNLVIAVGVIFLLVVAFLALFLFRSNKAKQKINAQLQEQKAIIEEKNKEIVDSITYAKRLQSAILPSDRLMKESLGDYFLLYKPKDIVAGDFYWMEKVGNKLLFAVCDCTGHGVPGAMVSVVCHNALHTVVTEMGITEPGKILDKVRELVVATFEKNEQEVRDGMDVSLCCYHPATGELEWAGANNPLWVIHSHDQENLVEFRPDKQAIGKTENAKAFSTQRLMVNAGDRIYLFSDGYADQFGGDKGKKMKSSNFQKLLLQSTTLSLANQEKELDSTFESWKGNFEQLDDVCVMGIQF
ncbi:MAG: SpoIIE family protein phosphatase [Flavobacteriales bacterium]|nr:SpoIIE family protein phosphatase [Flavobacteriales bacterium]